MEISGVRQLAVRKHKKAEKGGFMNPNACGDMVNKGFLFFGDKWRCDFKFLSTVAC